MEFERILEKNGGKGNICLRYLCLCSDWTVDKNGGFADFSFLGLAHGTRHDEVPILGTKGKVCFSEA